MASEAHRFGTGATLVENDIACPQAQSTLKLGKSFLPITGAGLGKKPEVFV